MTDATPPPAAENGDARPRAAGLVAEFPTAETLKAAAARMREHGFTRWDAHSPFPIHGIDRAMGLRPTPLAWLVLAGGVVGGLAALGMQWWMNAVDYPLVISGKPLFGLPATIPIAFELIVLLSGLAAFGGALALCRLPQFSHFAFRAPRFRRVTSDGFFLSIAAEDPKFDVSATPALLESFGATAVETCHEETTGRELPGALRAGLIVVAALAILPPLLVALARQGKSEKPRIHPILHMDFQPKYQAQAESALFADRRAMRPPVAGTIAVGNLHADEHWSLGYRAEPAPAAPEQAEEAKEETTGQEKEKGKGKEKDAGKDERDYFATFPPRVLQRASELMDCGRERFGIYCAPCHGLVGDGNGMTSIRALERRDPEWLTPTSIHATAILRQPVGKIYHTIANGLGKMPGYAAQVSVEDRWAIVLYVRALQRSQNAPIDDVPKDVRDRLR